MSLALRSKLTYVMVLEVSFVASTANHAAGSNATLNLLNLFDPATGARVTRPVTITVGTTALNAAAVADLWVAALNTTLSAYGCAAVRCGSPVYGNFMVVCPYTVDAPYPSPALTNTSSMFAGLATIAFTNPLLEADLVTAAAALDASAAEIADLKHQVDVLELQVAGSGGGSTSPGSTSVVVNNPATDTAQTVMAAVAGFGIGFMVRNAQKGDD